MSVPSVKLSVTCERPNLVSERISSMPGSPAISRSMTCVISFSDSSAASAETSVLICTCTPVMSGTASIGRCVADHKPTPSKATAPSKTMARWRSENSRMRAIMVSEFDSEFSEAKHHHTVAGEHRGYGSTKRKPERNTAFKQHRKHDEQHE